MSPYEKAAIKAADIAQTKYKDTYLQNLVRYVWKLFVHTGLKKYLIPSICETWWVWYIFLLFIILVEVNQ